MKVNNLNLTLEWQTVRDVPDFVEFDYAFPKYNVQIKNEEGTLIHSELDLDYHEPIQEFKWLDFGNEPIKKAKFNLNVSKSKTKNIFKYAFENNYKKYKDLNNKIGFYKKIKFYVNYNNDGKGNFELPVEYSELENIDKNILFNKIYRSNDYLTIKFLINKEYFKQKDIYSILVLSEVSNKVLKNKKLNNLFTEKVEEKWLDVNDETALLTIPFIESDIVEISENLNVKIIPLNFCQSEMYKFFKNYENEENINNLYTDFFKHQVFDIGKIYKQVANNETVIYYQNYLYLFNKDSLQNNSLKQDLILNGTIFNSYFPLLNKDQQNKTICLSDDLNTDYILDNTYNLQKDYLGYYNKNLVEYEDVGIDLDYFESQNILKTSLIEIEENNDNCDIYIEFITNFYNNERFYIETSNNLKLYEKYKTLINEKEYITFVLKYSYTLDSLNNYLLENSDKNKNQIISDKDLINFSAKIIF